jgi:competence protein ComEC
MGRFGQHQFRRSTLYLGLFIGILAGLGFARVTQQASLLLCLVTAATLTIIWRQRSWKTLIVMALFGVSLGWWRGAAYMLQLAHYEQLYGQKVTVLVHAQDDAIYDNKKQLSFSGGDIRLPSGQRLIGKLQVGGFGANAVFQGDEVIISGKLLPGYGSYQGKISFGTLAVQAHHPTFVSELRRKFIAGTHSALPEPLAPFVMGILVGQRATLPDEVKENFRVVGLTHIIAVSGYNLTIILQASRRLLGGQSKRMATFLSLGLIGVFLLLTGSSASIVRAAIVSMLSIVTAYYGRGWQPLNLILFAAVITAMANPIYMWSDLGWYLSFLAFFGVMVLSPLIQTRWQAKWHQSLLGSVALETICAEIMTLPFILHIFGQMSRVGLLANILVVTLIPLAMLLGLVAGLAGMLLPMISGWLSWPAVILLNYMLDVAHILANWPNVFVQGIGLSLGQMLVLYGCIAVFVSVLWYKSPRKNGMITDIDTTKVRGVMS